MSVEAWDLLTAEKRTYVSDLRSERQNRGVATLQVQDILKNMHFRLEAETEHKDGSQQV